MTVLKIYFYVPLFLLLCWVSPSYCKVVVEKQKPSLWFPKVRQMGLPHTLHYVMGAIVMNITYTQL